MLVELGEVVLVLEPDDGKSHFFNVFGEFGAEAGFASN